MKIGYKITINNVGIKFKKNCMAGVWGHNFLNGQIYICICQISADKFCWQFANDIVMIPSVVLPATYIAFAREFLKSDGT